MCSHSPADKPRLPTPSVAFADVALPPHLSHYVDSCDAVINQKATIFNLSAVKFVSPNLLAIRLGCRLLSLSISEAQKWASKSKYKCTPQYLRVCEKETWQPFIRPTARGLQSILFYVAQLKYFICFPCRALSPFVQTSQQRSSLLSCWLLSPPSSCWHKDVAMSPRSNNLML